MPVVPVVFILAASLAPATSFKFAFGPGTAAPGYVQVSSSAVYTKEAGYGFDLGSTGAAAPFFFSVDVPEGNYNVTVTLGDPAGECVTTVKAESRRLMLEKVRTATGQIRDADFHRQRPQRRLASAARERPRRLAGEIERPGAGRAPLGRQADAGVQQRAPVRWRARDQQGGRHPHGLPGGRLHGDRPAARTRHELGADAAALLQARRGRRQPRRIRRDAQVLHHRTAARQDSEPDEEGRLPVHPVRPQRHEARTGRRLTWRRSRPTRRTSRSSSPRRGGAARRPCW